MSSDHWRVTYALTSYRIRLDRTAGAPDSALMQLRAKRLVWTSETKTGATLDAAVVKAITGGGMITSRPPYGTHEVEFSPSHTLFMMTNHPPHTPSNDLALWMRMILIPFEKAFVANPQFEGESLADQKLLDKLKAEAPGILRWMVEGCMRWQEIGIYPPSAVTKAVEAYRSSEDVLSRFIDECCNIKEDAKMRARELYHGYCRWCQNSGIEQIMTETTFGKEMTKKFEKKSTSKGNLYVGLSLRVNSN